MDVLLIHQELEVDVQQHCRVGHEDVLHVVVLVGTIAVPDEVPDETLHYEPVAAHLLQEVALPFDHLLVVDLLYLLLGFLELEGSLVTLEGKGLRVDLFHFAVLGDLRDLLLLGPLEKNGKTFFPVLVDGDIDDGSIISVLDVALAVL